MLEVKKLAKSFGNRQILQNMNFSLKDGEILTVVGPSGAGKTTLMKCISGAVIPDTGTVSFPEARRPGDIGVVFDECHLPMGQHRCLGSPRRA